MDGSNTVLADDLARFVRAMASPPEEPFEELAALNREREFPTVGPEVGAALRVLARATGAERAFEFGSGLGYSAFWIAPVLPADGELVLTDFDADNLEIAREYLERGGFADRARFEVGDATDIYDRYDGPFDLVLVDNHEDEYVETFEQVREDVPPGGVVCADNVMGGPAVDRAGAVAALEGDRDAGDLDASTRAVVEYLRHVREDPAFDTCLLPVGEGLVVSVRR